MKSHTDLYYFSVVSSVYKLVGKNDKHETPKEQVSSPPCKYTRRFLHFLIYLHVIHIIYFCTLHLALLKINKPTSESKQTEKKPETTVKPVSHNEQSLKEVGAPKKSETGKIYNHSN